MYISFSKILYESNAKNVILNTPKPKILTLNNHETQSDWSSPWEIALVKLNRRLWRVFASGTLNFVHCVIHGTGNDMRQICKASKESRAEKEFILFTTMWRSQAPNSWRRDRHRRDGHLEFDNCPSHKRRHAPHISLNLKMSQEFKPNWLLQVDAAQFFGSTPLTYNLSFTLQTLFCPDWPNSQRLELSSAQTLPIPKSTQ